MMATVVCSKQALTGMLLVLVAVLCSFDFGGTGCVAVVFGFAILLLQVAADDLFGRVMATPTFELFVPWIQWICLRAWALAVYCALLLQSFATRRQGLYRFFHTVVFILAAIMVLTFMCLYAPLVFAISSVLKWMSVAFSYFVPVAIPRVTTTENTRGSKQQKRHARLARRKLWRKSFKQNARIEAVRMRRTHNRYVIEGDFLIFLFDQDVSLQF